jgi:TonB family protein
LSKDLLFSIILHVVAVGVGLFSSPFEHTKKMDFGEVIKVKLMAPSDIQNLETPALPPPVIPKAIMEEEIVDIPLDDPRSIKKKKEVKKPETKPKEEKKPEPKSAAQTTEQQPSEKEIETQSTSAGQMFAGATVHNQSFDYPYWFDQAFNKISANFSNPVSSDAPIIAVVYFEVIKTGRVVRVEVQQSSDIQPFDDACVRAIQRSEPFPPLPKSFRDEIIGISLPFKFEPH